MTGVTQVTTLIFSAFSIVKAVNYAKFAIYVKTAMKIMTTILLNL